MSLLSKLTKNIGTFGIDLLGSKPIKKVGGNSNIIKTTSQTVGSMIPSIAGGKPVQKAVAQTVAKGSGGFAKVAGKVAVGTGLAGGVVLGGTKVYDYIQDVRAKTPEQRQAEQAFGLYEDIIENQSKYPNQVSETSPSAIGDDGGSNFMRFYDGLKDNTADEAGKSGLSWGLILGSGVVLTGLIYANKKGMFKKKK